MSLYRIFITGFLLFFTVPSLAIVAPHDGVPTGIDLRVELYPDKPVIPDPIQLKLAAQLRAHLPNLQVRYDFSFGNLSSIYNRSGYLTGVSDGDSIEIAKAYFNNNIDLFGLTSTDLISMQLIDNVSNDSTGSRHLYWQQSYLDIPVYGGQLQVNVNRESRILSVNNSFISGIENTVIATSPSITAKQAKRAGRKSLRRLTRQQKQNPPPPIPEADMLEGHPDGVLLRAKKTPVLPEPKLMFLAMAKNDTRLVWNFQLYRPAKRDIFNFNVDATTGEVLLRQTWTMNAYYSTFSPPIESPNHTTPLPPADGRTWPLIDPALPPFGYYDSSPYGWHDLDGLMPYVDINMPWGNNIISGRKLGPYLHIQPCLGGPKCSVNPGILQIGPTTTPLNNSAQVKASVHNQFFWNNYYHDVTYRYGFNTTAGNFQLQNNGLLGTPGINIWAFSMYPILCNAGFSTWPQGSPNPSAMHLGFCDASNDGRFTNMSWDNGVIVHEYTHGMSNRMVGGPSVIGCLYYLQTPCEGISDFMALAFTHEQGDTGADYRGMGTFAFEQPINGPGIRPQPYSTDTAINNYTYESINPWIPSLHHFVGSVWAQASWEVYWALVDKHGFDADLYGYNGGSGNQRMLLYMIEGLNNAPFEPDFIEMRDGIIQAVIDNYSSEDLCLVWDAFAQFGLGINAITTPTAVTNGFDNPPECCATPPDGMVAWWPGDFGGEEIKFGNSGLLNGVTVITAGKVKRAMLFDGINDYVDVSSNLALVDAAFSFGNPGSGNNGDFSIDTWVNTTQTSTGVLVSRYNAVLKTGWALVMIAGKPLVFLRDGGNTITTWPVPVSVPLINDGTWHHIAVTADRSNAGQVEIKIFIDGVFVQGTLLSGLFGSLDTSVPVTIGAAQLLGGPAWYFDGMLDEIEVFNEIISNTDIEDIYIAGSAGKCKTHCIPPPQLTDMVAWWPGDLNGREIIANNNAVGTMYADNNPGGKIYGAFTLDGGNGIWKAPNAPGYNFDAGEDFSIDAWIRWKGGSVSGVRTIVDKRDSTPLRGYSLYTWNGRLGIQLADPSGYTNWNTPPVSTVSTLSITDGEWHHVAASIERLNPTGGKLFIDGALVRSFDPTGRIGSLVNSGSVLIGHKAGTIDRWDGDIDEIEIWQTAISDNDVSNIFDADYNGKCASHTSRPVQ